MEIEQFTVLKKEDAIIACIAFYPYPEQSMAEVACVVIHPRLSKG